MSVLDSFLKFRIGLVILLSKLLRLSISIKNKIPFIRKSLFLENALNRANLMAANLISEIIDRSFKKVQVKLSKAELSRLNKTKVTKTKARVASKAKKPKKASKAKTNRK